MLLKHTLLYLPAQFVGPLFQLLAMIVWTHVVDEHTLGVITLITATHELLQIGFLAWWSQYALRFLGRYEDADDAPRFYRTESGIVLVTREMLRKVEQDLTTGFNPPHMGTSIGAQTSAGAQPPAAPTEVEYDPRAAALNPDMAAAHAARLQQTAQTEPSVDAPEEPSPQLELGLNPNAADGDRKPS